MNKFEMGERVYSTDRYAEGRFGTVRKISGETMKCSVDFGDIRLWKFESNIEKAIKRCDCGSELVYHDKRQQKVCLFCDIND